MAARARINERLDVVEGNVNSMRNELAAAETKIETAEASFDDMSYRMRINVLRFYGLPEKVNETRDDTADSVTTFVRTYLGRVMGSFERSQWQQKGLTLPMKPWYAF